jgi:hypothetical protein
MEQRFAEVLDRLEELIGEEFDQVDLEEQLLVALPQQFP